MQFVNPLQHSCSTHTHMHTAETDWVLSVSGMTKVVEVIHRRSGSLVSEYPGKCKGHAQGCGPIVR